MSRSETSWASVIIVLLFLGISVGAIAGARATDSPELTLIGVIAAVVGTVLLLVLKIEKPTHFSLLPQVLLIVFIIGGAAAIMLIQWGPVTGLVIGAAYGAMFSLLMGWNYAHSLRKNQKKSG